MKNALQQSTYCMAGLVVRQLRILVSQFRVLRTGTLSEIRSATCTNRVYLVVDSMESPIQYRGLNILFSLRIAFAN